VEPSTQPPGQLPASHQPESYQKVALRGVTLAVRLGAYPEERLAPQPVAVDVELFRRQGAFPTNGTLADCLDYDRIRRWLIETWPQRPHTDLLEQLAEDLVAFCLADARVEACRVILRKPAIYGATAVPELEVFRWRRSPPTGVMSLKQGPSA
jgi:FolB domain-containing protein